MQIAHSHIYHNHIRPLHESAAVFFFLINYIRSLQNVHIYLKNIYKTVKLFLKALINAFLALMMPATTSGKKLVIC